MKMEFLRNPMFYFLGVPAMICLVAYTWFIVEVLRQ